MEPEHDKTKPNLSVIFNSDEHGLSVKAVKQPSISSIEEDEEDKEEASIEVHLEADSTPAPAKVAIPSSPHVTDNEVPSTSRSLLPASQTRLDSILVSYKNAMENWPSLQTQTEIIELHNESVYSVTKELSPDLRESVLVKLNNCLMYILELFEEQHGTPITTTPLAIYFDTKELKMGISTSSGSGFSSSRFSVTYPSKILKSKDDLLSFIFRAGKMIDYKNLDKLSTSQKSLIDLFVWIKKYTSKFQENGFEQVIIVIPTWFRLEHRMVLRNSVHLAQFSKCHLVTEASLGAFSVLVKPLKEIPVLTVVSVGYLGVEVGMYTIIKRAVKMISVERYEWELQNADMATSGCLCFGGPSKLKRAMESEQDPVRVLKSVFTKALDQLEGNMKQQRREIYVVTDSEKWRDAFKGFMEQCPEAGDWKSFEENWGLLAAMNLSKSASTGKLRKVVVDHVIPVDDEVEAVYFWY